MLNNAMVKTKQAQRQATRRALIAVGASAFAWWPAPATLGDELVLSGGDRLTGAIVEFDDTHVIIEHDVLGRLEIAAEQVASISRDESAGEVAPAMLQEQPPAVEEEKEWKSHFVLGLSAAMGNTDTQSFNVGITSVRETDRETTTLDASYYYGASSGDRTDNKFTAGVRQDWLIPDSKWFYFAQGRYDYDEFQSWEHRIGAHGGVGYRLIEKEDFKLSLRAGAGAVKEFGSDDEDLRPEGLFGVDLAWQITERQTLTASTTVYPDLGEIGEFRVVSGAIWSALMDEEAGMSLNVGLEHEYQSQVDPGVDRNDLRIVAGLRFDF